MYSVVIYLKLTAQDDEQFHTWGQDIGQARQVLAFDTMI